MSPAGGTARLRPGYNVVPVDGAALKYLLEALFYPGAPGDVLGASAPAKAAVRLGVTLIGNDGITYRVVRGSGAACQLHRLDPQRRAFALASQDASVIARYLASAGVPGRERLELLTISAASLPSRWTGGIGSASVALMPQRKTLSRAEAVARLGELREELARAKRAEKLQYQLDGLQSRLFKLEEALKERGRIEEALQAAMSALGQCGPAASVAEKLGDIEARLEAHGKALAKRDEALARVEVERSEIDEVDAQGPPRSFWKDPAFGAAVGAGVIAIAAAFASAEMGPGFRYIALFDIPAFGWAAWVALRWVAAMEERGRLGRRRSLVEEHERKVLDAFDRDTAELRGAMKELGVNGIPELREVLNKLSDARADVAASRERLDAFQARPETRSAEQDKAQVEVELRKVESALAATAGGYVRDPRSVEMEIERVGAEAAQERAEEVTPTAEEVVPQPAGDPFRELLERAGGEFGGSPAAAARAVEAKASEFLRTLSGNRFSGLGIDDRGNLLAQAAGRSSPAAGLSPADRDLAFVALKLAFIERALAATKGLALADDAFSGMSEVTRRLAGRVLKQVARPGQLLHATSDVAFRESADHLA